MIVLVWSLVSSVVELARKRRLVSALSVYFSDPGGSTMIVARRIEPQLRNVSSATRMARYTSEPQLNTERVLYRNEKSEVIIQDSEPLASSEWRFVPRVASDADRPIFFVATASHNHDSAYSSQGQTPVFAIFLESSCERVAWNRLQPSSLYCCSRSMFEDVIYAFSEGALFENHTGATVDSLHTVSISSVDSGGVNPISSSVNSSLTHLSQARPMPVLEQLFWGDSSAISAIKARFSSESALHLPTGSFGSLPRRLTVQCSPRRRNRSCTSGGSVRSSLDRHSVSLIQDWPAKSARCFAQYTNTLPPYIRQLEQRRATPSPCRTPPSGMDNSTGRSYGCESLGVSPSITIEEIERLAADLLDSSRSDDGLVDIPYVDDSDFAQTPHSQYEKSSFAIVLIRPDGLGDASSADQKERNSVADEENQTLEQRNSVIDEEKQTEDKENKEEEEQKEVMIEVKEVEEEAAPVVVEEKTMVEEKQHKVEKLPPLPPMVHNGNGLANGHGRRSERNSLKSNGNGLDMTRRRHSAMVDTVADNFYASFSSRMRSLSPMPLQEYCRRSSLRGIRDRAIFETDTYRRPHTPTRRFTSFKDRTQKAMNKPPSILVYTGGQSDLYGRIRSSLSHIVPSDRYTVFNISSEAIRKQPWMEPTTACLVIADTNDLNDDAWSKMQIYFNQAGKIIFVCQNRLLASLTNCDSSKKQGDILRMAFGSKNNSVTLGKEFEQFLKKSLTKLTKHKEINETFHSKDLAAGMSYSVILTKHKDSPLLLYMQNSAHQAAAVFSDATTDELLAPGSRILSDSLSRIGVNVSDITPPSLSGGVLYAQEDGLIENLMGVRYGEDIGLQPKIFLRRSDRVAEQGLPPATDALLPVEVKPRCSTPSAMFNHELYFNTLKTNKLGRFVLHVPVCETTMNISASLCDAIPTCDGSIVIAGQQLRGQGRGGNEFVSPLGCAMFTIAFTLPNSSSIAKTLSFVQHIFAVALVDAVRELSRVEDFPLCIKWPNDFYYNRSHKVGGLLASARSRDDGIQVSIGAGLNVFNSQPTVCLNDMIPEGIDVQFTIEEVIAETANKLEYWMNNYEIKGPTELLKKYYEFWLHSREEVFLEELGEKVQIRGLDKYGFLQVRSKKNTSQLFSIGDNGNTFDMMKGLIRHKIM